jgi:16S rRNA (cytidine1402-2'-O)-methyltransferase
MLSARKSIALISEAGTPAISDPGALLVAEVSSILHDKVKVVPVPGPSAAVAALSAAGFISQQFFFAGFPPSKRKRQKFFKDSFKSAAPVIFYESPHRILKTISDIIAILGKSSLTRQAVVFRELTKQFETSYRGTLKDIADVIGKDQIRGEFVIVIGPP